MGSVSRMRSCFGVPTPAVLLVFLTSVLLLKCDATLYKDQHESSSWLHMYMGDIDTAVVPQGLPYVVAANSEQLVLLDQHDGTIIWRRHVPVDSVCVKAVSDVIISVSGFLVQAWRIRTGQLLWQSYRSERVVPCCSDDSSMYWIEGQFLYVHASADGAMLWEKHVMTSGAAVQACDILGSSIRIAAVGRRDLTELKAVVLNKGDRTMLSSRANFQLKLSNRAHIREGFVAVVSEDQGSVCVAALDTLNASASCHELPHHQEGRQLVESMDLGMLVSTISSTKPAWFQFNPAQEPTFVPLPVNVAAASTVSGGGDTYIASASLSSSSTLMTLTVSNWLSDVVVYNTTIETHSAIRVDGTMARPLSLWAFSHTDDDYWCVSPKMSCPSSS